MASYFTTRTGSRRNASDASTQSVLSHNRTNSSTNSKTRPGKFESLDNFAVPSTLTNGSSTCKLPDYKDISALSIFKRGQIIHIKDRQLEGDTCVHESRIHDRIVLILSYDLQAARCLPFCYHEDESHVNGYHANVVASTLPLLEPQATNLSVEPASPPEPGRGCRPSISESATQADDSLFQASVNLKWAREHYRPKPTTYLNMSEIWRIEFTGVEFAILGAIDDSCWRELRLRVAKDFIKSLELDNVDLIILQPAMNQSTPAVPDATTHTSGPGGREERPRGSDHNKKQGIPQKEDRSPKGKDRDKRNPRRSSEMRMGFF